MKKRLFSLLLAAILLSSAMISCSDNSVNNETEEDSSQTQVEAANTDNTESETATDTENAETLPAPETKDMGGAELIMLNYKPESFSWANTQIFASDLTGEILNDALYNREIKVEDAYNCKITELPSSSPVSDFKNSVSAGDSSFDTAMAFDADIAGILTGGYLISWNTTGIDFSNPWWDSAATEQYCFSGIQASVSGAFSLYNYSTRHCYVFNTEMLNNVSPGTNLYTLVREGTWTQDKLYEIAANAVLDTDGDGVMTPGTDRYGITGTITRHYSALLAGAGVKYIDRDENGSIVFNIEGNENAQTIISHIVSLNVGNDIHSSGHNDIGAGDRTPMFYDQQALFAAVYVGEAARMRDADFEIGIVPPPKYNESQADYFSLVEGGAQSIIPKTLTGESLEKTATILDAFAYYSYIESVPAYIDFVLMKKVANNEDTAEMLQIVFDNSFYDLGTGVWSGQAKNMFTSSIFLPKSDDLTSLIAKNSKVLSKTLEKFETAVADLGE